MKPPALARSIAALFLAALLLASCGSHGANNTTSRFTPLTTDDIPASSICGNDEGDYVKQELNGDFSGCFRVPNFSRSKEIVALEGDLFNTPKTTGAPTTTTVPTVSDAMTITLSKKSAIPGSLVTVSGRLQKPVSQRRSSATLCWDGCTGLQESVRVHWSSSTRFSMQLTVPETAWIVSSEKSVTVHPLLSDTYEVGVQCLLAISGCDFGLPEAQSQLILKAPSSTRCSGSETCASLHLSTKKANVGEEVLVTGWAPVQQIIGAPSTYSLSLTPGDVSRSYPSFSSQLIAKGGDRRVVIAPTTLTVTPSTKWASLGKIPFQSAVYSGPSSLSTLPSGTRTAWCAPDGIDVDSYGTRRTIPITGEVQAFDDTVLNVFHNEVSSCVEVQLDPNDPDSYYAGFETAEGSSIPPEFLGPLYTTNNGITWQTVPAPAGLSLADFGGFFVNGTAVDAYFDSWNYHTKRTAPYNTDNGIVEIETTINGGATWTPTTLGCPTVGPCATLGPYEWGYCNMSYDWQPLLVSNEQGSSGLVRWQNSSWGGPLNSCWTQQLVAASSTELFLLDPSSQYPLLESNDGGEIWKYIALPKISAQQYGDDSTPVGNELVLAPDGSLFSLVLSENGQSQSLYRLKPSATSWCTVSNAFGTSVKKSGSASSLQVTNTDLEWLQTKDADSGSGVISEHSVSFAKLKC